MINKRYYSPSSDLADKITQSSNKRVINGISPNGVEKPNCVIQVDEIKTFNYHVQLFNGIEEYSDYMPLFKLLRDAGQNDKIYIHINSPGGYCYIAIEIINAIFNTSAHVVTILEHDAHSCASMIFLAGHEQIVAKHSNMLIHSYSGIVWGKNQEMVSHADHNKDLYRELFRDIYEGFLTKEEIDKVLNNEDIWLDYKHIIERLISRNTYFEKINKKTKKSEKIKSNVKKKKTTKHVVKKKVEEETK